MNIVIRTDASHIIGHGHVMRCLTLAEALTKHGASVTFITRSHTGNLDSYIKGKGFQLISLPKAVNTKWLGVEQQLDADQSIQQLPKRQIDWLIVDHYALDAIWHQQLKPYVTKIMVIDDLANRQYDCNLLLDTTLSRLAENYHPYTPKECSLLLGPKYSLLREQFQSFRAQSLSYRKPFNTRQRHLVSMGGSDPTNSTLFVLKAIHKAKLNSEINVVVNKNSEHLSSIKRQIKKMNMTVYLYYFIENMAELMSKSDVAIGTAGSSSWERCCLGLPSILLITEENQQLVASSLAEKNCIINLGSFETLKIENLVQSLLDLTDYNLRQKLSHAAAKICNGNGVNLVMQALLNEH